MKQITVNSSSELDQIVADANSKNVILLFTGTKKSDTGKSWCPDCVVADPVIESVVKNSNDGEGLFVTIPVGDLPTWRSDSNQYRKHPKYAINCVPTLVNVAKDLRLEEGGCADQSLVQKLFDGLLQKGTVSKSGTCEGGVCRLR